ncbi:unnamed protein product, partial [Ranitomeya imitator]
YGMPQGGYPQQDPMYGYFLAIAGQDGQIDADELQRCLSQAGMSGGYSRKCPEKIQIIGDLQKNNEKRDYSGKLGFNEFKELGMALNSWRQNFMTFDVDRSGTIGPMELHSAVATMGQVVLLNDTIGFIISCIGKWGGGIPSAVKLQKKVQFHVCVHQLQKLTYHYDSPGHYEFVDTKHVAEESASTANLREMIRTEVRESLRSMSQAGSSKQRTSVISDSSEEDKEEGSYGSNLSSSSSEEESGRFCLPLDRVDKLVKSVRGTMGLEEPKTQLSRQQLMFSGLEHKKRRSFPVNDKIQDLILREWKKPEKKGSLPPALKRRYPFEDTTVDTWDKAPKLDAAVAKASKRAALPFEDMGSLNPFLTSDVRPLHIKRRCSDTDNDPDRCSVAVWSLESCHTDRSPATNDAGNQGKHRRDYSGKLGFNEFKELGMALNSWRQNFMTFDVDRSGTIGPMELHRAVATMGYRLSPQALNIIAKRYSTHGKIKFDDYVSCCVRLRAMTDSFRRRDVAQQGMVNFQYDDSQPEDPEHGADAALEWDREVSIASAGGPELAATPAPDPHSAPVSPPAQAPQHSAPSDDSASMHTAASGSYEVIMICVLTPAAIFSEGTSNPRILRLFRPRVIPPIPGWAASLSQSVADLTRVSQTLVSALDRLPLQTPAVASGSQEPPPETSLLSYKRSRQERRSESSSRSISPHGPPPRLVSHRSSSPESGEALSDAPSEDISELDPNQIATMSETVQNLIRAINQTCGIQDPSTEPADQAVSFRLAKPPSKFFAPHPEFEEILARERERESNQTFSEG